jgi:hypothetical protein
LDSSLPRLKPTNSVKINTLNVATSSRRSTGVPRVDGQSFGELRCKADAGSSAPLNAMAMSSALLRRDEEGNGSGGPEGKRHEADAAMSSGIPLLSLVGIEESFHRILRIHRNVPKPDTGNTKNNCDY